MAGNNNRRASNNQNQNQNQNQRGQTSAQAGGSSLPRTRSSGPASSPSEPAAALAPANGAAGKKRGPPWKRNGEAPQANDPKTGPRHSLPVAPLAQSASLPATPVNKLTSISTPAPAGRKAAIGSAPATATPSLRRSPSIEDVDDDGEGNRGVNPLPRDHPRLMIDSDEDPDADLEIGLIGKGKGRAVEGEGWGNFDFNLGRHTKDLASAPTLDALQDINVARFEEMQIRDNDPGSISLNLAAATTRANSPASDFPFLFTKMGRFLQLRIEPMEASILNYHATYDPLLDRDPITEYGAVDGNMPGSTSELSIRFRDLVIRWSSVHRALNGNSVESASETLASLKLTDARLASKTTDGITSHFLSYDLLLQCGHVVLALNQILTSLNYLLGRSKRNSYMLDPSYQFLRLLENSDSRPELYIAFSTLQKRLILARSVVNKFLFEVRAAHGMADDDELDVRERMSDTDSTISSVRSSFGLRSPRTELGKMLLRPDYESQADLIDSNARAKLTSHAREQGAREFDAYYRPSRTYVIEPNYTLPSRSELEERTRSAPETRRARFAPSPSTGQLETFSPRNGRAPLPPSAVAYAKSADHPISHLPGVSFSIPKNFGAENGGPSMMRPSTPSRVPPLGLGQPPTFMKGPPASQNPSDNGAPARIPGILPTATLPRPILARTTNDPLNTFDRQAPPHFPRASTNTSAYATPNAYAVPSDRPREATSERGGAGGGGGGGDDDSNGSDFGGFPFGSGGRGGRGGRRGYALGRGGYHGTGGRNQGGGYTGGSGGDGGGNGPGDGGGGGDDGPWNEGGYYARPQTPWNEDWQLNHKISLSQVPAWDGEGDSVIDYLNSMADLCQFGSRVVVQLGQWAPMRWTGKAKEWWDGHTMDDKSWMRSTWVYLGVAVRNYFCDEKWVVERTMEFEEMRFRQTGHEKEKPTDYYRRRKRYHSFLYPEEADGKVAVARIIRLAPAPWRSKLNENDCPNIHSLMHAARLYETELLTDWFVMRRMERFTSGFHNFSKNQTSKGSKSKEAHTTMRLEDDDSEGAFDFLDEEEESENEETSRPRESTAEAHASTSKSNPRQKKFGDKKRVDYPAGKTVGGYHFARDDSKESVRPPPGECFICTSPKHFARDCPHHGRWEVLKNAHMINVEIDQEQEELEDRLYLSAILESQSASLYPGDSLQAESTRTALAVSGLHTKLPNLDNRNVRRRNAEEKRKFSKRPENSDATSRQVLPRNIRRSKLKGSKASVDLPAADENGVIKVPKRRALPEGFASLGTKALHFKAHVDSIYARAIRARLDSGADITLISEDFWKELPGLPKPKEGLRIKLYHLTGDAKVLGYVRFSLLARSTEGDVLSFEVEAYVVKGMRVPILLGEDFQRTYELGLQRYADGHSEVLVQRSRHVIPASSAQEVNLGFEIRHANRAKSYVRAKAVRRAKTKARKNPQLPTDVLATKDVILGPGAVHNVEVSGPFEGRTDWLVEKVIIGTEDANVMAAPTTWISTNAPYLPIANPSSTPRYIRAGDVVGHLLDPVIALDSPKDAEHADRLAASVEAMKTIIEGTLRAQELIHSEPKNSCAEDDRLDGDNNWGPKTTALPDEPTDEVDVAKLVNLGPDVPDDIKPRLEEVLRKNFKAFGVDGRLGEVNAQVPIPLVPGTNPISVPMYGASPAKREVIEKQVNAWFEAGVIEPSKSPWGFPVVVVYRNGKPRLVVDYRKLNAKTIPDEFPIPRQSEIIQSLSGAQVLSCFDALAGFTQLDMADDAKERTAFRCHLGLWQFRRMPFGLRNGPSIFQRIMQGVLAPYLWLFTLVYIDDIVVFSKSWEEHLRHLDIVLGAIAEAGITLSPSKCFVGYSSILLLGQKVSRLGLSTHEEKVQAIQELERPSCVADLQKFLGMVVYFSSYIPYYAFIASPLFALLKKGVRWEWGAEHEIAFEKAKAALAGAPVLGHPIQNQPYRLYTDASDYAAGACLQQIQPIEVRDLEGTAAYARLKKAWDAGEPVPSLTTSFVKDLVECPSSRTWGTTLDATVVHVERVIAYWSRTLKPAERNYSATEREALAAKDALVKFQPFIEGEKIILITDHSALQWARVYENANRRLAAWGAVFAAYPDLKIVHRPGKIHSNVDPLSRLPRVPSHNSPSRDHTTSIIPSESTTDKAQRFEDYKESAPAARATFIVSSWEDVISKNSFVIQTRSRANARESETPAPTVPKTAESGNDKTPKDEFPFPQGDHWTYPVGVKQPVGEPEDRWESSHLLVALNDETREMFVEGYQKDPHYAKKYIVKEQASPDTVLTPSRFQKGSNGLLYFIDADWQARLCVPHELRGFVLKWIHDSPYESAHAGYRRLQSRLRELFYWPTMLKDAEKFVETCDVCQKIKSDHLKKMGGLRPAHIPVRPFETVSLDLITGLPPSGPENYTAILVVVCKLTKYGIALPTHDTMNKEEFAKVFVREVVNKYGLPRRIISDRDKRWTSDFWRSIVARYKSYMALSSAHHPQTDGQTENLNASIEVMLRAYVAQDRNSWSEWLSEVMHAYNSATHSSTSYSPDFLLMGYQPRTASAVIDASEDPVKRPFLPSQQAEDFVAELEKHRQLARDALVLAQERQAKAYNKSRRPVKMLEEGDYALVNPHSLELIDVKGTGRKLVQRTIGPFEVMERINPVVYRLRLPDNYPMHPVFNLQHLKLYRPSPAEFGERTTLPPTRDSDLATEEYEVEAILGHKLSNRRTGNRRMYLVRWEGYGPEDDSWISEYDLRNSPELRREYHKLHKLPE